MQIDLSDEHREKPETPSIGRSISLAKLTIESSQHSWKQNFEITLTDDGMQIDLSDEHSLNANSPRTATRDPLSNAMIDRLRHLKNADPEMISMDDGMQMDCISKVVGIESRPFSDVTRTTRPETQIQFRGNSCWMDHRSHSNI
jgi:hypothetical protein